ncbi:PREDICTED: POU domain, class 6, transcription factor 1 isoform X2 [Elephantulus edwardii]|uniref:POU domain, class 6, transcription factor 1 isoform X2 n=1 Tax=Elephantulus edwardii TaxID=28737 RepID=UPI0003F0CD92|nr:PREDICTED: POU domain, class 6, transcription factor 1 isoform X2 [Elephantulus edwardii]
MEPGPGPDASLTVNEQVIVMSGHETIRVLEVGVDTQLPIEEESKGLEGVAAEGSQSRGPAKASGPLNEAEPNNPDSSAEAAVTSRDPAESCPCCCYLQPSPKPASGIADPDATGCTSCPPGQVAGQQGLAVWTIPTATVATLPGLTAASPTGGIFKPPLAGLQAAAVLNTALPAPVQAAPPVQASSPAQPRPPAQSQPLFQAQPLLQTTPAILPQPTAATAAAPTPKPVDTLPQITVQPAGFAFSPGIISAASLGGQTQILGSLTTTPVIANAIPSMPGISSQILTNAQGQVIGTLPWVVNSASMATPAPAQSLQVQAVTPQLLLNAQGQVIATLASSPLPPPATIRKPSTPESPAKSEVQPIQPTPAVPQPTVVIASPVPAAKSSASAPIPITCSETPTVSQLVSKPHTTSLDEDGINLEEIREFAKNFKIRRLSLGLTQTQVGQALTATEGPAYSQSAICRFEKLDITPKSAQKLKPVLEKWLNEAELRNQEGQQNLMEFVGGEPSKKRKRRTSFTPQAIEALNAYFEKNPLPTGQEITEIAKELNYDREVVRVWFCNRRQTLKNTSKLNVFQIP